MPYSLNPNEFTTWHLAEMAECGSPDAPDGIGTTPPPAESPTPSPGARLLRHVANAVAEHIEYAGEKFDAHEIADGAPSVYTWERWQEFVDLAAWREDPDDLGAGDDMTERAGVCLYIIAERLAKALVQYAVETADEDEEDA